MSDEKNTTDEQALATEEAGAEAPQKLDLTIKVDQPNPCQRHVTVSISRADVDRYFDRAYSDLMPRAAVPGFRPGRAPRKLVEQRFKKEIVDQVKGSLLMDSMTQVTEESKFSAISEPDFDFEAIELPDEGPMTFEFELEVRPEFDMPQWKGLSIEKPVRSLKPEDIDARLKTLLSSRYGELKTVEAPAKLDDFVLVDIEFSHGGKVLSAYEGELVRVKPVLSLHDGKVNGFDDLIVGKQAGESVTGKVAISNDVGDESLRGAEVDAKFTIKEVQTESIPEMTPEFLQKIGDFENEAALREVVERDLERQVSYRQHQQVRQQISALLTESANWELPPELLKRQSRRELERAVLELRSSGFPEETIRQHENELRQNSLASTARALKEHFILERIAEDEKLEDKPEDYETEISLIAYQSGESPRRVRARLEKRGMMDTLRNQIIERKAIELIKSHAQFKEVPYKLEADEIEAIGLAVIKDSEDIPEAKHDHAEGIKAPSARG